MDASPRLTALFRAIVARRWWVVAAYLVLLAPTVYFALRVHHDNAIDRLIVQSDPDYVTAKEFERWSAAAGKGGSLPGPADPSRPRGRRPSAAMGRGWRRRPGLEGTPG